MSIEQITLKDLFDKEKAVVEAFRPVSHLQCKVSERWCNR